MTELTTSENLAKKLDDLCKELERGFPKETGIHYEIHVKKNRIEILIINPQYGFYDSEEVDWDEFEKSDSFKYLEAAVHEHLGRNFDIKEASIATMSDRKGENKFQIIESIYIKCPVDLLSYNRVSAQRY